jgi:hypothetical protein
MKEMVARDKVSKYPGQVRTHAILVSQFVGTRRIILTLLIHHCLTDGAREAKGLAIGVMKIMADWGTEILNAMANHQSHTGS